MRILIIEDDPLLLRSLAAMLREENYAVDTAADGESGLYKSTVSDYDCIVLDGMLPILDGWDILRQLRQIKHTPVLMLTARDTIPDRVRGLDAGADDYLTKPFDGEELLARIRALIRRSLGRTTSVLRIGEISIDTAAREVSLRDMPVLLTPREYALVEYLAHRQGTVVSRTELYEHLFSDDDDTLSNLLDVHVSNIRKKIGHEFIQTRRGHGYLIAANPDSES
ncbi:response regulator transcription factor [Luteolibacter pohnpeiensis]|uniref:Response regulator transcription factor n=1 Tax=Luteolibacter pohnpeiensis TaxID=454153 RepID=A0A934S9P1_9BACT|nr:response regulator transcription factor [Luteolibacter pohnpeiensis]MBK1883935.1 response regulator transcription factor [Luteolibacter pohnpeiensis]